MGELLTAVLEKYDIKVNNIKRGRGAFICETVQGIKLLKEYKGTLPRLLFEHDLLNYIYNHGFICIDRINMNKDGEVLTNDLDGTKYILKDWFAGRECDVKNEKDIYEGISTLATLHRIMNKIEGIDCQIFKKIPKNELKSEFERHNQELKRARGFMRDKRHKSQFELEILACYDEFYGLCIEASQMLKDSLYDKLLQQSYEEITVYHGDYNYHNILFCGKDTMITNFNRSAIGLHICDVYLFFRKVMEKHNWDINIGYNLLERYDKIRNINEDEKDILKTMLTYPEKFWKIVNHYYNNNKAWIPAKNIEKLHMICRQNDLKARFLREM